MRKRGRETDEQTERRREIDGDRERKRGRETYKQKEMVRERERGRE